MNNFKEIFKDKKAFIPFITAGDPDLDSTVEFIDTLIEAGASLIEIGIPFSDPIAEGKTIEKADVRALTAGTTTDKIFDMLKVVREKHPTFPLVFMTYINPVFTYGYDKFFKKAMEVNMLGIIIPDIPYEEKKEVDEVCKKYNQVCISLIAPTSQDRIKMIAEDAKGFVYLVSSLGVTGVRDTITTNIDELVLEIKKYTDIPVCVGFGIKSKEQAKLMTNIADGAIIGSKIVSIIEEYGKDSKEHIYSFCKGVVEELNK